MKLCFATNNAHKLRELRQLVAPEIELLSLEDIGCSDEIPETGNTLQENALQKAEFIKQKYGISCFADDTGLEVAYLNGAPGVYSARYAGEPSDSIKNVELLLTNLEGAPDRSAQFRTVIALLIDNAPPVYFEGTVKGEITQNPRGESGFGYDPVFIPNGFRHTFAEMTPQQKNKISHRAIAVEKLVHFLSNLT
ncbi:MAG: non-canonical purine NTP diphosphatase [Cyclobacteriaceae bacterium]|nr:non-canonical purine NTP diphosphatase [Cyclobacteriaceae bacterium]